MARYICPSCGEGYNGKRCRQCNYEHFTEEIAHGNHVHKGEPLVISAPVRKSIPRKDPFGCEPKTKKKRKFKPALVIALLAVLNPLLGIVGNLVEEISDVVTIAPEPEPELSIPPDVVIINDHPEVLVCAQWEPGQIFDGSLPIYIQNDSREDVEICGWEIAVNGYILDDSVLFGAAEGYETTRTELYLSQEDLAHSGIEEIQEISFYLEIYNSETYEVLEKTQTILLDYVAPSGNVQPNPAEGEVVFDQEGIRGEYLGYAPDDYDPEDVQRGALLFYFENNTDEKIQIDLSEPYVNGEESFLYGYAELPPRSKTVMDMSLYALEDHGIDTLEEFRQLSFKIAVWNPAQYDAFLLSDEITISIP